MALPERHTADPPCQRRCTMRFPPVRPRVISPERRHAWVLRFELERDALCVWQDLVANRLRRGPNWRASSSGVRPFRTSSTIRCRNSGAYGGWLFGIVDLPFCPNDGCPRNRVNSSGTCDSTLGASGVFLYEVLGGKALDAVTRADCRALIAACREKGLSRKSIENIRRTLSGPSLSQSLPRCSAAGDGQLHRVSQRGRYAGNRSPAPRISCSPGPEP